MPVVRPVDAAEYETHGSTFLSFTSPSPHPGELRAWRLTVPAGLQGMPHRPTRDEVVLVLDGLLVVTLDGTSEELRHGDVALVPAGSELRVDAGPDGATAWVTTTPGLEAVLPDGTRFRPPWAA